VKAFFAHIRNLEVTLKGKPVAPGIAFGQVLVLKHVDITAIQQNKRPIENISIETARLEQACRVSREQVNKTLADIRLNARPNIVAIFSAYLNCLDDPGLLDNIKLLIEERKLSSECIIADQIIEIKAKQKNSETDFSRKLYDTLLDLYLRLIYNLLPMNFDCVAQIRKAGSPVIAIAEKLTPVEVANMPTGKLLAVVIEDATNTSHAAILSRTLSVPVVVNLPGFGSLLDETCEIIVDGYRGHVVINPNKRTIEEYRKLEKKIIAKKKSSPAQSIGLYCTTSDGVEVKLAANAGSLAETEEANRSGINEIGLLRSEMFYLGRLKIPSIEEESDFYNKIFSNGMNKVAIRLLDIGADKIPAYLAIAQEDNPELGLRGMRYLLFYPDILKNQIRSILRCAKPGSTKILLPFVSIMEDLDQGLSIITGILSESGFSRESVEIGIMVEVPSVALSIEDYLPKVDFINLGTNDLIQYIVAAGREQANLSKYGRFTNPVFLKIIRNVINAADRHGKELVACGAMSSHPYGISLLIGLGARNFSLPIDAIPEIRKTVSRVSSNELEALASNLDSYKYSSEVEEKIKRLLG
jgi:phosphotransferase system enzyme I (PtsI)